MRFLLLICVLVLLACAAPAGASASDWADATPTAWHQLARAESLLTAPEPPNPVAVCIVDSGVNITPDLEGVVIERLAYDGGDPGDTYPQEGIDDGHGTYVATFLAGQVNGWGGAGLWPRAKIVSVRVFPPGAKRARANDYIEGLRMCGQHRDVRVINLSLGDLAATETELRELEDQIRRFRDVDNLNVVAAAGNRGGAVEAPARFRAAFAVGAVNGTGSLWEFSARGPELDVLAPGCGLPGADQRGQDAVFAGTSFAAPMVAGTLAALRAYRGFSAAEAEARLLATARAQDGGPVIDAAAALEPMKFGHGSSSPAPAPILESSPSISDVMLSPDFVDYRRPRYRLRRFRGRAAVSVVITNRPRDARVEIRQGNRVKEISSNRVYLRRGRVRVRFISNRGASPWIVVALH